MQIKRILATVMMAAVLVTSATACGNGKETNNSSVTSEVSAAEVSLSETAGSGYSDDNDTKVRQMLEKVTFNGEPLTIPYKASDLGEGFTFSDNVDTYQNDEGEEFNITTLEDDYDSFGGASIYDYTSELKIEDFVAYTIGYSVLDDERYEDMLQIDGISGGNTMDDVLEKFGEPTNSELAGGYIYYYEIDDNTYISFWGAEDNSIIQVNVCNKPSE